MPTLKQWFSGKEQEIAAMVTPLTTIYDELTLFLQVNKDLNDTDREAIQTLEKAIQKRTAQMQRATGVRDNIGVILSVAKP